MHNILSFFIKWAVFILCFGSVTFADESGDNLAETEDNFQEFSNDNRSDELKPLDENYSDKNSSDVQSEMGGYTPILGYYTNFIENDSHKETTIPTIPMPKSNDDEEEEIALLAPKSNNDDEEEEIVLPASELNENEEEEIVLPVSELNENENEEEDEAEETVLPTSEPNEDEEEEIILPTPKSTNDNSTQRKHKTKHKIRKGYFKVGGTLDSPLSFKNNSDINQSPPGSFAVDLGIGREFLPRLNFGLDYQYKPGQKSTFTENSSTASWGYSSHTLLLRANYDLIEDTRFSPYVLAGIGTSLFYPYNYTLESSVNLKGKSSVDLAWKAGFGCAMKSWNNVDSFIEYSYLNRGKIQTHSGNNQVAVKGSAVSHNITVGLTYNFK